MTCPHAHLDASYVLGALTPSERVSYEEHLTGCADCSGSVQRLAGLPGLLTRVPPDTFDDRPPAPPLPPVLPELLRSARRHRRRRQLLSAALASAATAVVLGSGVLLLGGDDDRTGGAPDPPDSQVFEAPQLTGGEDSVMTEASLSYARVLWGTRLDLTCTYSTEYRTPDGWYSLRVRTTDGEVSQVGSWRGLPGKTMTITAATATAAENIESVEVHTGTGALVARWEG